MSNIGFRVKFNEYIDSKEKAKEFIDLYFSKFNTMEVKVNEAFVNSSNFEYVLSLLEKRNISFHLSKDYINNPTREDIILIHTLIGTQNISAVTHMPENMSLRALEQISAKNNLNLLLENPTIIKNYEYLNYLIHFYQLLECYPRIGGCLDLGHLLFNEIISNGNNYLDVLLKNINLSKILEYHIHDFTEQKDHQKLGDGLMDLENIITTLGDTFLNSRIILESNVDAPDLSDGVGQVRKLLNSKTHK